MFRRLQSMVLRRGNTIILAVATILVGLSLLVTNIIAEQLRTKEQHDVELWAAAMERTNLDTTGNYTNDPLIQAIINNRNNIPFIITDENLRVISHHLIPEEVVNDEEKLQSVLEKMAEENTPIVVRFWWTQHHNHIIFYGRSITLRTLYIFPYIQMFLIVVFVVIILVAFRSVKQGEQKRFSGSITRAGPHYARRCESAARREWSAGIDLSQFRRPRPRGAHPLPSAQYLCNMRFFKQALVRCPI